MNSLLSTLFALIAAVSAVWPQPRHYEHGSSVMWLSPDVQLLYSFDPQGQPFDWIWSNVQRFIPDADNDTILKREEKSKGLLVPAFNRMKTNVLSRSFVPCKFYPRGTQFEPPGNGSKQHIEEIVISEASLEDMEDEGYTMEIGDNGRVAITVAEPSAGTYMPYAPLLIKDSPTFSHRGLNLDISRNWIPPTDVMRTIEAMATAKMNRLHLHASDAQSWPLEIPSLPDLAIKGAYDPSQIWYTGDLETVQRHGATFGVEVFVEIDMPGHTTAIGNAFPHLVTAKGQQWDKYAVEPPSGQLRLNSTEVPPFIDALLTDLLGRTSKYGRFFHLGGDELNLNAYLLDPTIQSSSKEVLQPLLSKLVNQIITLARSHSLTVIMWEEMLLEWDLTLPENIIVQTWRSKPDNTLSAVLDKGHKTLFGSNAYWYLDCGFGTFLDPEPSNPDTPIKRPYLDYCQPYKNWRHMYAYDPLVDVSEHQKHLIIGGEVHLWGELTDSINLDGMLWPRVAAAAEVMWSGPGKEPDESVTRRLADFRERLLTRGFKAGVVQMEWCLRNKGGCRL